MSEKFSFFGKRDGGKPRPEDTMTLPSSVLQSITYSEDGSVGKQEMLRLVRDGTDTPTAFANAALFSVLKANVSNPDFQRSILEAVVSGLKNIPANQQEEARSAIRVIAEHFIRQLPNDEKINAAKLKRLNLAGFQNWDDHYARAAIRLSHDQRSVFIVANSTLIGLSSFIRSFREADKVLHILLPQNMNKNGAGSVSDQRANYPVGYAIQPHGSVESLGKNFKRPLSAVIVDDIRRTGETEEQIRNFWKADSGAVLTFEPLENIGGK